MASGKQIDIPELLRLCRVADNATSVSDVHIVENARPWVRVNGRVQCVDDAPPFGDAAIKEFYEQNLSPVLLRALATDNYVTSSVHSPIFGDVRIHIFRKTDGLDLVIRLLNGNVPSIQRLRLPKIIQTFVDTANGLYLFSGPTGSGKSTALAAVINEINRKYDYTIFTVEDPIEYKYRSDRSLIRQLAVGQDVQDYQHAIRSFLRADPDVLLIGEMRDSETMEAALRAAQTGHLVFSTVHDNGAAETCQRVCGSFSGDRQEQIKMTFASVVRGVVSLKLLTTADEKGRVPVCEIMIMNDAIRNQIRKGEFQQIRSSIQQGRDYGMMTLEDDLNRLLSEGIITREAAIEASNIPKEIKA
jgi:twitching motility protein PilT